MLFGRQSLLIARELYAIPVLFGCASVLVVLHDVPEHRAAGSLPSGLGIFALRGAAIHWELSVPDGLATKTKEQT